MPSKPLVPRQKYGFNDSFCAQVIVTAAQVLAMNGAPVQILAAPGAGYVLTNLQFQIETLPGSTNFAAGGAVSFVYHGGSITPHGSSVPAATINSGTGTINDIPPNPAVIQPPLNTGIDITNATGAFTTGNGQLIVTVWGNVARTGLPINSF